MRPPVFWSRLITPHSVWPEATLRRFSLLFNDSALRTLRRTLKSEKKYHLDARLDIEFIAAYTDAIDKLVYYPFIILALLIFSRSKIFDNWDTPIGLIIIFLSAAALTLGGAFCLRRVARQARQEVIKNITSMKMALSGQPDSTARQTMEKQIDLALAQIQEINEGAFQPLTNDPVFQALLLPFGGFSGVILLENLVLNGF